ncbi:MAG: aspartyl protease family protein [Vicinamibacteria bacterium]
MSSASAPAARPPAPWTRLPFSSPRFDVPDAFARAFRLVMVDAEVNGRPARFLVDVGMRHTAVFAAVAERLGLEAQGPETVSVGLGGDNRVLTRATRIDTLRVGTFRLDGLRARMMTDDACFHIVRERSDCQMDGVLGLDLLARFAVDVDSAAGTVTLTYRRRGERPAAAGSCDFSPSFPYVVVDSRIAGLDRTGHVFVDTGSPISMISPALAERLGHPGSEAAPPLPYFVAGGGRISRVPVVPALSLSLGGEPVLLGPVGVIDLQVIAGALRRPVDVLLGCDVLRAHAVGFDFPERALCCGPLSEPEITP